MTKLEDVRKALELCRYDPDPYDDDQPCKLMVSCEICPYWDETCGCRETDLYNDALELLEASEPRVVSAEEIRQMIGKPVWLETQYKRVYTGWALVYDIQTGLGITGERVGITQPCGRVSWFCSIQEYGRTWRLWTAEPSEEDMRADALPAYGGRGSK